MNEVIDYLKKKISKVNLGNPKANTGGALIKSHKGWEDKIDRLTVIAFQVIAAQFNRKHHTYIPGTAALTSTSMSVGKHTAPYIQREPLNTKNQLALGDLLIEGFVYHGFIELQSPAPKSSEPYSLRAAPKWTELAEIPNALIKHAIIGSTLTKPEPITENTQLIGDRQVRIHKTHGHLFKKDAPYIKALDKLQAVKWTINERVLNVLNKNTPSDEMIKDNDVKEQKRRSKLIAHKFTTRKAEYLKDAECFYQIFDIDYRGRIYNIEPFLNFQSNDDAKGLLQFAEAKPLTERGEFWLAVHTACSYNQSYSKDEIPEWCQADYTSFLELEGLDNISVDKMTLEDRAQWTYQNANLIIEWAETDSLRTEAEKPYIFLACCYEWQDIERYGPYTTMPVAVDGSNNGWQHLGAISKDTDTGKLVGLVPVEIPQDFYVQTAKELYNLTTDEHLKSILNSMPMKHIRKGISKRGSMTRAYSAGSKKIAENMYFDCKVEDFHELYGITEKDCKKFASTLIKAIENVCPGPLNTMKYLQDLALYELGKYDVDGPGGSKQFKEIKERRWELIRKEEKTDEEINELDDLSKALNEYSYGLVEGNGNPYIKWNTPSGFITLYEKYSMTTFKQRARLNGKQIKHALNTPTDRPDTHGFMCGISPNFIHSMDAAHLALIAADWNGDFGAVHDSFSTHASEVDDLLEKTKKVFIEMYDHPNYFKVIREEITGNTDNIAPPELGELNIKEIEDSDYFFA